MSSEVVTGIPERAAHRPGRTLAIQLLGPVTILGGIVWAIAQPPLLVVFVGAMFALLIAPGLVHDLESESGSES